MGGRKRKVRKIAYAVISTAGVLLAIYFILVNVLVSAALVPSFMRRLDAFSRITELCGAGADGGYQRKWTGGFG